MGAFVGLWLAGIALGIVIAITNPARSDIPDKVAQQRKVAIFAGFIPCIGFMIFVQIVSLLGYRAGIKSTERTRAKLQPGLQTSFGEPSGGGASGTIPPNTNRAPQADNPFL